MTGIHVRLGIAAIFAALAAAIAIPALLTSHAKKAAPGSEVSGVVVYSGVVVSSPDVTWWLTVKDHRGIETTVTVSQAVYDACWIDAFKPAAYPACARNASQDRQQVAYGLTGIGGAR